MRKVDVELGRFACLIGANATGKSTLLDALQLVSDCISDTVSQAIARRGTQIEELFWFSQDQSIDIAVEVPLPPTERGNGRHRFARYELSIGRLQDGTPGVLRDSLFFRPAGAQTPRVMHERTPTGWKKIVGQRENGSTYLHAEVGSWKTIWSVGNARSSLAVIPEAEGRLKRTVAVRGLLRDGVRKLALYPPGIARPTSPRDPKLFLPDGSNLPLVIAELQRSDVDRFDDWLDHVREALPDIDSIRIAERAEDRHRYIILTYKGGFEVPAWRLSDGTLRILALTLLAFAEGATISLVEEPENGVHPRALEAVYQALSQPSHGQVIVATHSPVFLGIVPVRDLLCLVREDRQTKVMPAERHPALRDWRGDVDLSVLFAAGILE